MHSEVAEARFKSAALFLTLALVSRCPAQTVPPPADEAVRKALQSMQQELDRLRHDNESMKGQIDELRAKTDADWLTEARANEIRGLVEDVLADADTRASLLQNGVMAGWLDHFFLASPDGRFKLILEGQMQIRWVLNHHDDSDSDRQGFENTRTRLTFRGHVFNEDWQYLIRGDFARASGGQVAAGAFGLLDAWVRYNLTDSWSVRAGQFKLPFNREQLVSSAEQLAVERSLINQAVSLGRSQGLELAYHDDVNAWNMAISDGASAPGFVLNALLGGPRTNTSALAEDVEYAATVRYERLMAGTWDQFNDFTSPVGDQYGMLFGIAGHSQQSESNGAPSFSRNETTDVGGTVDLSIEWGGANGFVSVTHHYIDSPGAGILNITGIVGQFGVYITPKWELFARGEWGQMEITGGSVAISDLGVMTLGANYYIEGHDVKWTTDVGYGLTQIEGLGVNAWGSDLAGWRPESPQGEPQIVIRTQIQLLF